MAETTYLYTKLLVSQSGPSCVIHHIEQREGGENTGSIAGALELRIGGKDGANSLS